MDDIEFYEQKLKQLNIRLKQVFDAERLMRDMGNSGMVKRRQDEYREVEEAIQKVKTKLESLRKELESKRKDYD